MKDLKWLALRLGALVATYYGVQFFTNSRALATIATVAVFLLTRKMAKDFLTIGRSS